MNVTGLDILTDTRHILCHKLLPRRDYRRGSQHGFGVSVRAGVVIRNAAVQLDQRLFRRMEPLILDPPMSLRWVASV
ncbi:MAG: hypothetical protein D3X82_17705 [Candidatus Leucobacter sulfamidivorax]|nr:hypothetical protein [Candidatus Leucobacter sulfamidivorax]MBL5975516.1 hypothetical protein [Candidatus Leucobacter sulfamidivorax]